MQESIRRQGPVKITAGSITVFCVGWAMGTAHAGAAIVDRNTWAIKGSYFYLRGEHTCKSNLPQTCVTAAELRVFEVFLRRCTTPNVHVKALVSDKEAAELLQTWRNQRREDKSYIPPWYRANAEALYGLARRVREWSSITFTHVQDSHDALKVANSINRVTISAMQRPNDQNTTPYLNERLDPLIAQLPG